MPSRRHVLGTIATAVASSLPGCGFFETTTGLVERKSISVGVPRTPGRPVEVTLALLYYEPDERLISGEFADIVPEVIENDSMSVSEAVHKRLTDRFAFVHYFSNVVPMDGPKTANGNLARPAFNSLSVGGIATVDPYMKRVDEDYSVGYLRLQKASPPDQPPKAVRIGQYSWDERIDGIRRK